MPHLLKPEAYHDHGQFEAEMQQLMWPAWHCVASTAKFNPLPKSQSFELLGVPLVIQWLSNEVVVRLDDSKPTGKQQLRALRRPIELRTGQIGQLVFVSLDPNGPSLHEHFGAEYDYLEDLFGSHWSACLESLREQPCNWKLLVENVLENYHLEEVHVKTFKHYPPPEACDHEMFVGGSSYVEVLPPKHSHLRDNGGMLARLMGVSPKEAYRHMVVYPHFTAGRMGFFNWAHCTLPISPVRTINAYWFFQLAPTRRGPVSAIGAAGLSLWGRRFFRTLLEEDAAVLPSVQLGMQAPKRPTGGLISAREERLFHFQRYVAERTGAIPALATTN
jgi:hypothetical protein